MSSLRVGLPSAFCAALAACLAASACGRYGYDLLSYDGDGGLVTGAPDAGAPDAVDAAPGTPDAPATDAGGNALTGEVVIASGSQDSQDPAIAFTGGDGFTVAWDDTRTASNVEIYLQHVVAGQLAGGNLRLTNATGYSGFPSLAWTGAELAVAWEDSRLGTDEVFFTRVDPAGAAVSQPAPIFKVSGTSYDPALVWDGTRYAVAWEDGNNNANEIYFATIATNGASNNVTSTLQRSNATGASLLPSLVWTGSEYGIAWEDRRSGGAQVFFARCSAAGAATGADPPALGGSGQSFGPSLAWNGTLYGVAYENNKSGTLAIYMTFLNPDGTTAGSEIQVSAGIGAATQAQLVWASDHWAVAYVQGAQLFLVEVPAVGLPGTPRPVSAAGSDADSPAMAWANGTYGIVWQDHRSGNWDVYFREVAP